MWDIFSKFFSFLFVLVVIVVVYLIFFAERDVQQDVLNYSLNLVGEKLFALVPEGQGKTKLINMYDNFKQKASEGEIDPKRIEHVTASILNVSNNEMPLTPKQAESVLQTALLLPEEPPAPLPKSEELMAPPERKALGERIKVIFEFNETMHSEMKKQKHKMPVLPGQVHYCIKDGLKLELHDSLKFTLNEAESKYLIGKLNTLEKMKLIEWRKNLPMELEEERKRIQMEIESIQKSLQEQEEEKALIPLEYLESVDSLLLLQNIPIIDTDSIGKVLNKSLEMARKAQLKKGK